MRYLITQYNVYPARGTVSAYYRDTVTGGSNLYAECSELAHPLDSDAWSNADLCAAVAAVIGCKYDEVGVEPVPPTPPAEDATDE
jgi:hypothetical protein